MFKSLIFTYEIKLLWNILFNFDNVSLLKNLQNKNNGKELVDANNK